MWHYFLQSVPAINQYWYLCLKDDLFVLIFPLSVCWLNSSISFLCIPESVLTWRYPLGCPFPSEDLRGFQSTKNIQFINPNKSYNICNKSLYLAILPNPFMAITKKFESVSEPRDKILFMSRARLVWKVFWILLEEWRGKVWNNFNLAHLINFTSKIIMNKYKNIINQ